AMVRSNPNFSLKIIETKTNFKNPLWFIVNKCLLAGISCQQWSVFMPQTIEGLSGSCVIIPCNFSMPLEWDPYLDQSCKAVWKRSSWSRTQVFDSSLTGASGGLNLLQGNLTGILRDKDCTTIFNNLPSNHYDNYYFRLQCDNPLKFNFQRSVRITTQGLDSGPVLEGSSVILTCSADANPEADSFAWYKVNGEQVEAVGFKSKLSTTATEVDNRFFCTAVNGYGSQNSSIARIEVQFAPKETTVLVEAAGPILEGSSVSLMCRSRSNPPVTNYTWYKENEADHQTGPVLVIDAIDSSHSGGYRCTAKNDLGEETSGKIQLDQYIVGIMALLYHLNCVTVDFAKLKARSEGEPEDGAVTGLAPKTAEYVEICHQCSESNEGDAKEQANLAGTQLGQGEDAKDLTEDATEKVTASS
uniref:Ig-like domain-containing protein n=1 Tax=Fundulus heteroclitus TaxID=8078 RepID=A0A3Q2QGH1_FUNHE